MGTGPMGLHTPGHATLGLGNSFALWKLGNEERIQQDEKKQEENSFLVSLWRSYHILEQSDDPCLGAEVQMLLKVIKPPGYFQPVTVLNSEILKAVPKVSILLNEAKFPSEFTNFSFKSTPVAEIFPEM